MDRVIINSLADVNGKLNMLLDVQGLVYNQAQPQGQAQEGSCPPSPVVTTAELNRAAAPPLSSATVRIDLDHDEGEMPAEHGAGAGAGGAAGAGHHGATGGGHTGRARGAPEPSAGDETEFFA
jgi:hypothetical protein